MCASRIASDHPLLHNHQQQVPTLSPFPYLLSLSCSPTAAATYLGGEPDHSTCGSTLCSDHDGSEDHLTISAQQLIIPQQPFPRPFQELLLPGMAGTAGHDAAGFVKLPQGVEIKEVADCVMPGSMQAVAEVSKRKG
jgi:hypothetical protein